MSKSAFGIGERPHDGATDLFSGLSASEASAAPATSAAVGISDEDGMLVYVTSTPAPDAAALLDRFLAGLGCSSRMMLPHPLTPALGGTTSLAGLAVPPADVG